jgi:hypothetical protein
MQLRQLRPQATQQRLRQLRRRAQRLAPRVVVTHHGQHKGRLRPLPLGQPRFRRIQVLQKVQVAIIFDQVCLTAAVKGQDFGPDEHQRGAQLDAGGLQQLEDVGEDADRQG